VVRFSQPTSSIKDFMQLYVPWDLKKRDCTLLGEVAIGDGELAGVNPAVIRQQMGHSSAAMTALHTGELPLEDVRTEFRLKFGPTIHALELLETEQQCESHLQNKSFASF
jgi:hypothetical protein